MVKVTLTVERINMLIPFTNFAIGKRRTMSTIYCRLFDELMSSQVRVMRRWWYIRPDGVSR
jgi:hypothetical protein